MFYRIAIVGFLLITLMSCAQSSKFNAKASWQDFVQVVEDNYAYLDTAPVDWPALKQHYSKQAIAIQSEEEFVDFLQVIKQFFIDPHFNVSPLNSNDFSVTPTGSDIWVAKHADKFVIERIKAGSAASKSKLSVGDTVTNIDGKTITEVINTVFNHTTFPLTDDHKVWAVNVALGGYRNQPRVVSANAQNGDVVTVNLAPSYEAINALKDGPALVVKEIDDVGYIRFNNNLGDSNTVSAFTRAIEELAHTKGLVIDLRNTPSGGNTGVAEPILGHFVDRKTAYQRYQLQTPQQNYQDATLQTAYVQPTAPHYNKPVVVLAGRWTGSMGEGMTIGFDAIGAKAVVGEPMADLLGGISQFTLPNSSITVELGFERLYHVNGSYRENFVPQSVANQDAFNHNTPSLNAMFNGDRELAYAVSMLADKFTGNFMAKNEAVE